MVYYIDDHSENIHISSSFSIAMWPNLSPNSSHVTIKSLTSLHLLMK